MHPDIIRQLISQHEADLTASARRAGLASSIRKAARAQRRGASQHVELPVIPDYVDGAFSKEIPAQRQPVFPADRTAA
jgi:hypothetical protein